MSWIGTETEERGDPDQVDYLRRLLGGRALELNLEDQVAFEHVHLSPFLVSVPSCCALTKYIVAGRMTSYRRFRTQVQPVSLPRI